MKEFLRTFDITVQTKILDVGGTPDNWTLIQCPAQITLLNIRLPNQTPKLPANMNFLQGDGTHIQFEDKSFDIVFSNSVIEHLFSHDNQRKFASEVERVGKSLWIQTPSRSFFFEPHYLTPFFQFLPKKLQVKFARNFTLWGWITRPSMEYIRTVVQEINLLNFKEFESLFPDCKIHREMFFFIYPKSFVAVKK